MKNKNEIIDKWEPTKLLDGIPEGEDKLLLAMLFEYIGSKLIEKYESLDEDFIQRVIPVSRQIYNMNPTVISKLPAPIIYIFIKNAHDEIETLPEVGYMEDEMSKINTDLMAISALKSMKEIIEPKTKTNNMKVYKFFATWCQPCKMLDTVFNDLEKEFQNEDIEFEKINIDDEDQIELITKHKIRSVPTVVIETEEQTETIIGYNNIHIYKQKIEELL